MHDMLITEVLTDCIAYSDHDAPASILDKWTKEQLAFALRDMASREKGFKQALRAKVLPSEKGTTTVSDALWDEIYEFIDDHVDVRDGADGPIPNRAMSLKSRIDEELP